MAYNFRMQKLKTISWLGIVFLLLIVAVVYLRPSANKNAQLKHVNIICIGDSITQGGGLGRPEYTYRYPLYKLLKKSGLSFDFIGTRQQGLDSNFKWPKDFDFDHEGYYGAKTVAVRDALKQNLLKLPPPDVALINLGENDWRDSTKKTVIEPLTEIVTMLRQRNPVVKVIIMQIPGTRTRLKLHFLIWHMARSLSTTVSEVTTVPLYWDWRPAKDTFDGDHPNASGQNKIAKKLYAELVRILPIKEQKNTN
jgi:lysophospholipase L1-like esterase